MTGVSVFIPVYNEAAIMEANLLRLGRHLADLGRPFEVIVGSNGSTDATVEIGRRLAGEHDWLTFFHQAEKGPGTAFVQGVRLAGQPLIVTQDMDLSVDLAFIDRAARLAERYDLIIGSKRMGAQERPLVRILGSGAFILTCRLLLGLPYQDYSLAAKAYDRALALDLLACVRPGTNYVLDMVFWAGRSGRSVIEVPVDCRDDRASRFNLLHEGFTRLYHLVRLFLSGRVLNRRPANRPGGPV